jgi:1-acyl-sn-glycerol-3-phosphate acyltransferase
MKKILAWITTPFFLVIFGILLLIFHPLMWLSHKLLGLKALEKVTYILQKALINLFWVSGSWLKVNNPYKKMLQNIQRPLIIVSNHQSMFDIPLILWSFRKNRPKFVAKREIGRGIPSISYFLYNGFHMLIDRKDKGQALKAIEKVAPTLEKNKWAAVIFAEGSRSNDGSMKPFKMAGLFKLLELMPTALVVPVAINNTWELAKNKYFPVPFHVNYGISVLEPIDPTQFTPEKLLQFIEEQIKNVVEKIQGKK